MSGPKAGGYEVDAAVLAARRRHSAALERQEQLARRRRALEVKQRARRRRGVPRVDLQLGAELHVDEGASTDEIEHRNAAAAATIERAERALAAAEHEERATTLDRQLRQLAADAVAARIRAATEAERRRQRPAPDGAPEPEATTATTAAAELLDQVTRAVRRLSADATEDERREIDTLAERVVAERGDLARARSLLVELRVRVQGANAAVRARAAAATTAAALRDELSGLTGPPVEWARDLLDTVIGGTGTLLPSDVDRIGRIKVAAELEAERAYVAGELAEAFRLAGCTVQQGFATELLAGRGAYTDLPGTAEHAVEVELRDHRYAVRVVRAHGPASAGADKAAEQEFCRVFGAVSGELYGRRVRHDLTEHAEPGEVEMPRVDAARVALERTGGTTLVQERTVDR